MRQRDAIRQPDEDHVMQFELVQVSPTADRVVLEGRLDSVTVARIETRFTALLANSERHAVFDLRGLDFLSSLGIRLLLSVARVVARRGGQVVAFGAQPMVAEVLGVMALDEVLPLFATEAEALAGLPA
jgi:anti-anti-sigma factor